MARGRGLAFAADGEWAQETCGKGRSSGLQDLTGVIILQWVKRWDKKPVMSGCRERENLPRERAGLDWVETADEQVFWVDVGKSPCAKFILWIKFGPWLLLSLKPWNWYCHTSLDIIPENVLFTYLNRLIILLHYIRHFNRILIYISVESFVRKKQQKKPLTVIRQNKMQT